MGDGQMIAVHPEELTFEVELEKPAYCNLRIVNNSEHHIAFKVKTTSPKKYFVRPNTSVVQPWDSCTITGCDPNSLYWLCVLLPFVWILFNDCLLCAILVYYRLIVTLQAQKEFPPDMQCKDKFLIQSTKVPPNIDIDEIPPGTFIKDEEKVIEECKLRVVYVNPQSGNANSAGESGITSAAMHSMRGSDRFKNSTTEEAHALQRLREERDSTIQQNKLLQRELETLQRRRSHRSDAGFSLTFAAIIGFIGLLVGILLKIALSSPSAA